MPRVQRCPKHTRRKPRKTGICTPYEPPYKTKYKRCPNGERKNKSTRVCKRYIPTTPKWKRCPKGQRKNPSGDGCIPFKSENKSQTDLEKKQKLLIQLNYERRKLMDMIKPKSEPLPESLSEPIKEKEDSHDSTESFLKEINGIKHPKLYDDINYEILKELSKPNILFARKFTSNPNIYKKIFNIFSNNLL